MVKVYKEDSGTLVMRTKGLKKAKAGAVKSSNQSEYDRAVATIKKQDAAKAKKKSVKKS